jgi:ribonuclease HI
LEKRKSKKSVVEAAFQGARRFEELHVFVDGAARGNPGPAAIGVLILTREDKRVSAFGEAIGQTTNNYAEYTALVHALRLLSVFEVDRLRLYTDSELMAKQVKGEYRVKEKTLHSLNAQVMSMLQRYKDWKITHIPREENTEADELANRALNEGAPVQGVPVRKPPPPPEGQSELFAAEVTEPEA